MRCEDITEITIPDGVTSIGNGAFNQCKSIKSIIIPRSVKNIGRSAFEYCFSLSEAVIKGELEFIGSFAFEYCNNLKEIVVYSESVKKLFSDTKFGVPKCCGVIVDPTMCISIGEEFLDGADIKSDFDNLASEEPEFELR